MQRLIETSQVMQDRAESDYINACRNCDFAEQALLKAHYERTLASERIKQWNSVPAPNWNLGYEILASEETT